MAGITPIAHEELIRVFEQAGFSRARQRGSHVTMVRPGLKRPLVIPCHGVVAVAIILSNLRTAGLTREQYFDLLDEL